MNHSLELVVSYAKKGHQVLEDCIGTLEEVFKFYYYSPKEYRHLRAVADTFGVIIDHFGGLKQLRWCASQHRAWKAMYDNYTVVVDHLAQMSNTFSDFNAEDRERASNLRTRLVSSKFVMFMHVMLDILKEVGKVSVKMQALSCIILDIPGFYNQLSTAIFSISEFTTPMVSQFLEEYNAAQLRWKGIKLKGTRKTRGVVNEAPEPTIQQQFQSLVGDFLGNVKHNLNVRFGIYTDPESLLSKFQIFYPNN